MTIETITLVVVAILAICWYYRRFHDVADDYYYADKIADAAAQYELNEKERREGKG